MQASIRTRLAGLTAIMAVTAAPVSAEGVAEFYKGKKIEVLVASSAGGGYDAYARNLARHMAKYLPGQPQMIVRNMPGSGGRIAATYLADVAAKDGTVILGGQPGPLAEAIFGDPKNVRYDATKFNYIGSTASFTTLCLIRTDSKVKSFEDLQKTEAVFGGDQLGSTTYDHAALFKNLAGAKIKLITGYKGTRNLTLALRRKEIEGFCGYAWASLMSRTPDLVNDKVVRLIVQYGLEPHPKATAAGVPQIWKFVKDDESRQALELAAALQEFGRPYLAPPGVPADRVQALRTAYNKTMQDAEFLADMKKARLDVTPIKGERVAELVTKMFSAPKAIQDKARAALKAD